MSEVGKKRDTQSRRGIACYAGKTRWRAIRVRGLSLSVTASVTLFTACTSTRGPELIVNSHIDYNRAVSQVLKEELLLNVVRRRYLEPLQFVSVSSISR